MEVKGCGGVRKGSPITYQLTVPKDHPDGPKPFNVSRENWATSLEFMADEANVLIVLDVEKFEIQKEFLVSFTGMLPKESYISHTSFYIEGNSKKSNVDAWVRSLQCPTERNAITKKYLICDWPTAAGFEAPAVIIVTDLNLNDPRYAAYCMRAKAKLVVCHSENVAQWEIAQARPKRGGWGPMGYPPGYWPNT